MASFEIDRIINRLWQPLEGHGLFNVYALVDAARSESIYPRIMETELENLCLHRGKRAEELAWVAPYLFRLQPEDSFTLWLLEQGWGKSRASFLRSSDSLNELCRHFRRYLTVYDEEGNSFFFRFYDPRVLRTYLPTCNSQELKTIFGSVANFIVEGEDPCVLMHFSLAGEALHKEEVSLA